MMERTFCRTAEPTSTREPTSRRSTSGQLRKTKQGRDRESHSPPDERGKAANSDEIPVEAIKADVETSTEMLHDLIGKIWDKEIPTAWKEGYIVKLPKKGDLQECKNYRGIMLLSESQKILNRLILDRLKQWWT